MHLLLKMELIPKMKRHFKYITARNSNVQFVFQNVSWYLYKICIYYLLGTCIIYDISLWDTR